MNSKEAFEWNRIHATEFNRVKKMLSSAAVLRQFNNTKKSIIFTGASRLHGIGYELMQQKRKEEPQLVMCGSRALTDEQANYATAKLEALAVPPPCCMASKEVSPVQDVRFGSIFPSVLRIVNPSSSSSVSSLTSSGKQLQPSAVTHQMKNGWTWSRPMGHPRGGARP